MAIFNSYVKLPEGILGYPPGNQTWLAEKRPVSLVDFPIQSAISIGDVPASHV